MKIEAIYQYPNGFCCFIIDVVKVHEVGEEGQYRGDPFTVTEVHTARKRSGKHVPQVVYSRPSCPTCKKLMDGISRHDGIRISNTWFCLEHGISFKLERCVLKRYHLGTCSLTLPPGETEPTADRCIYSTPE